MSRNLDAVPPEVLLEDLPAEMAALAQELRAIVAAAVPDALERVRTGWRVIGYDAPLSARRGAFFAWIMPQHEHVHLGFPNGAALLDPAGVLGGEGVTKRARWFTLATAEDLASPRLAEYTQAAAQLARLGRR